MKSAALLPRIVTPELNRWAPVFHGTIDVIKYLKEHEELDRWTYITSVVKVKRHRGPCPFVSMPQGFTNLCLVTQLAQELDLGSETRVHSVPLAVETIGTQHVASELLLKFPKLAQSMTGLQDKESLVSIRFPNLGRIASQEFGLEIDDVFTSYSEDQCLDWAATMMHRHSYFFQENKISVVGMKTWVVGAPHILSRIAAHTSPEFFVMRNLGTSAH